MKELFEIQQRLVSNKGNFNEFGKFSYRSLENILADVKPLLNELRCTITFTDDMVLIGERYYVKSKVTLENENGEQKEAIAFAREDESRAGMSESQVTGTASSYARKYAICSLLAINEEQDPDSMNNNQTKKQTASPIKVKAVAEIDFQQALTDYCTALKNNGFDKNEILKFFNYYKSAIEKGWRGREFNAEKLWINWNKKVA